MKVVASGHLDDQGQVISRKLLSAWLSATYPG